MRVTPEIRQSHLLDEAALEALYPAAFPDENLLPLVRGLLRQDRDVLSLVACVEGRLAGHIALTFCAIDGMPAKVALLGPLAVTPQWQGCGIGGALIRAAVSGLRTRGVSWLYVLGDPGYYGRFGFRPEAHVAAPYDIPEAWRPGWQSMALAPDTGRQEEGMAGEMAIRPAGTLIVPPVWRHEALWQP